MFTDRAFEAAAEEGRVPIHDRRGTPSRQTWPYAPARAVKS